MIRRTAAAFAVFAVLSSEPVFAHAPHVSTSRLSLRDEHLELVAEWDLFLLAADTPTAIATADDASFAALYRGLIATIERETKLTVDGQPIALEVRGFPSPEEFRGLAASLSASGEDHGPIVRIRLEGSQAVHAPRTLTLASPKALGEVIASFVQPATRYVAPGEAARFVVLGERLDAASSPVGSSSASPAPVPRALGVVVGALALTAGITYVLKRRSSHGTSS